MATRVDITTQGEWFEIESDIVEWEHGGFDATFERDGNGGLTVWSFDPQVGHSTANLSRDQTTQLINWLQEGQN